MTIRTRKSPVLVALSKKRSQLYRDVKDMEIQLKNTLAEIETLDCTFLLLGIACDQELGRPRRRYERTFKHNELKRFIVNTLKDAATPLTTRQITNSVRLKKGLLQDCRVHVKRAIHRYRVTIKVGENENGEALWALKAQAAKPKQSPPQFRVV
ncbi:hypothetical protein OAN24_02530 [Pseudodesulfovibrio sp.]|nr:hypothetical protein [Pseudodesulfovibrio sp.]